MAHQPIRDEFNEESITEYIYGSLGGWFSGYGIDVELAKEHFRIAIEEAFKAYSRANPAYKRTIITVVEGQVKYLLPYVGRGVTEVQPDKYDSLMSTGATMSINLGDGVVSTVSPALKNTFGIDAVYEALIYGEMYRRIIGGDFQYEIEGEYLFVWNVPAECTKLAVIFTDSHDYGSVPVAARDWLERFALAKAKEILGRNRGKFATPGPAGQQFMQDAANLVPEGQQEQKEMRDELRRRTAPLPPSWMN